MNVQVGRFLRIEEVCRSTGLKRSMVYETEGFPKPVKLGPRASGWVEAEVEAWKVSRIQARNVSVDGGADEA